MREGAKRADVFLILYAMAETRRDGNARERTSETHLASLLDEAETDLRSQSSRRLRNECCCGCIVVRNVSRLRVKEENVAGGGEEGGWQRGQRGRRGKRG